MNEGDKLINLNLQIEQNKEDLYFETGFKLHIFEALYLIQHFHGRYKFWDILFTVIEFFQLMAFPMDKVFDESWGNHWVETIGNFFRYFQIIFLWQGTTFFLVTYILICIFIIAFLSLLSYAVIKSTTFVSEKAIKLIAIVIQIQSIFNIPILKTFFAIFSCENEVIEALPEIKCKSGIHIFLIIISILFTISYKLIIILLHTTLYEFGVNPNKLKAGYSSSTEVLLDIIKLLLILLYQFILHKMTLSIITLCISIILLFNYLVMQPYSNGFTMKLYLSLYTLFCWSCITCLGSILLKNSNFRSGIILLILGYPIILLMIYLREMEFSFERYFSLYVSNYRGGYNSLLEIEYFLKLEDSLAEKLKIREYKLLFIYISKYEEKCTDPNCFLKRFMKIKFVPDNFEMLRILLLKHAEMLYKQAITKYPNNIKLRIGLILFLFKKRNKKLKGKNEIILLDKFEKNLECGFLIYKVKKFAKNNLNDKEEVKELDNNNISLSMSFKLMSKKIKILIEKIVSNYASFWNMLLINDWNSNENFTKMSLLGEDIKSLNHELSKNIKSLENWNFLDQETIKIYIQYLKEIINNNEKANIYNNKISDDEQNKHLYDEINLFELNYKEMSKNEDYKYIIINYSKEGFNKIFNVSFPVCKIFGYNKEELIGRPLDILLPEIYNNDLKLFFQNKVNEYKHNLVINNRKINSESWTMDCYGIGKEKFLIRFRSKWILTIFDDEQIYGIGNILPENKKILNDVEQETVHVLTDKHLIIQNFTANAIKILNLNYNAINNDIHISNYIKELNENIIKEFELNQPKEESNINNMKNHNTKRKSRYIRTDILKKYNYLENNTIKIIHWRPNGILNSLNLKNNIGNNKHNKIRKDFTNNEMSSFSIKTQKPNKSSEDLLFIDNNHNHNKDRNRKTSPVVNKGINFTAIYKVEFNKINNSNESNIKEKPIGKKIREQLFNMLVKEVKFNEHKVGYIFIFRPYINSEGEKNIKSINANEGIKELASSQEFKNMNVSDISLISFGEDKNKINNAQKAFGNLIINNQNSDMFFQYFCTEKEYQFTFDAYDMAYKQFKYFSENNSLYEELKDEAIKKITKVKNKMKNEESEEEEESSEYEYTSEEDNSENSIELSKSKKETLSSKNFNKKIIEENKEKSLSKQSTFSKKKTQSSKNVNAQLSNKNILKNIIESNKKEVEDFYHVNFNKITYYVFNYTSGYVELQKGQNHKISHVTYVMNQEKEKLKHSNSIYIATAKYMKGRKKGVINKKEENETNPYSITSMKLKEIYRTLQSKHKEKSIIKMFLYSIIIFVLVVGMGIMNILIYNYLKGSIYSFFILIQKSDNLYQNLLFEISLVKEMLILNSSYYNNTLNKDKNIYYQSLSRIIYNYYFENAFILSNLTNNFNILNKEDEESIIQKQIELYILDPLNSTKFNYQYKSYKILVYSAYRELNSALYHISELKMEEIYQYNDDVYYFLKNGMSNLLISSEQQMLTISRKFNEKIKVGQNIIIFCCAGIFIIYCFCVFIFSFFYNKVTAKKQTYLSIFNEFDNNLIISFIQKCEKFFQKLQERKNDKELKDEKISFESSSANYSEIENDTASFLHDKKIKDEKILQSINNKKEQKKKIKKSYLFQVILFLVLFAWQVGSNIYYYFRMNLYNNVITYEYYISMYASNFLFLFISLREYIFDKNFKFYNQTVDEFVNKTLGNYYVIFSQSAKEKDVYRVIFPDSYQDFLNYLHSTKICEFISIYLKEYPNDKKINCDTFFYGSSRFGYFTVLANFVEELRTMRDKIDTYYLIAKQKNFTYNESYFNDPNGAYEELYKRYENIKDEYRNYNPAKILNSDSHKRLLITYLYINTQVYSSLISESLKQFEKLFSKYNSIYLIINVIFLIVVALGFLFLWTPFIFGENKNFHKIKIMLSIIPSELLMNLPDINILVGIE